MPFGKLPSDKKEVEKILKERAKRRLVLREQFQKLKSDPFRHASGEGETVFDPAIQRYHAMKMHSFDHFKPTFSNAFKGLVFMILPMTGFGYLVHTTRMACETNLRSGKVAYKDRLRKFN